MLHIHVYAVKQVAVLLLTSLPGFPLAFISPVLLAPVPSLTELEPTPLWKHYSRFSHYKEERGGGVG